MAEAAPLSTAHAHARKAAHETQQIHWSEAANEHQSAATDYARASRSTSDVEALRILKLLEEQHQRLARIVRSQDKLDESEAQAEANTTQLVSTFSRTQDVQPSSPLPVNSPAPKARPSTSALAAANTGSHVRDSSPSLAREIASRRGIPQSKRTQPSAAAQARARQLSPESHRRARAAPTPKIPPSIVDSQASLSQARTARRVEDDEGFAKFYSNLTSGTMSKLSSVLAYAGLPLTADDIKAEPKSARETVRSGHEPDMKKIFSKAALNAIEEEHRRRGTLGQGFGPAESFYVVPTSGGTQSYSSIVGSMVGFDRASHQLGGVGEDDEEAFVDAREAPGPPSPRHSRAAQTHRGSFGKARTSEELELENVTLKQTLERLTGRLANFEAHAQDASMAALTQSMVGLRPLGGTSDAATAERLRQLEQQVEKDAEERQKLETHASRQEKQLRRWNDRYQTLLGGAREKMSQRADKQTDEAGGEAQAG
ncbi:hypothetical protein LTR36_001891 [Oleoguttula mirabilis]|uniref:Uncharacterized protein n=1 Tax=Oleoguttula mirabilis TaxID=1507867 RepID=A0AAV9JN26_9PEZI|nr:hypothetical protein LTR36_001891 [Oleoguttula mirabilis]